MFSFGENVANYGEPGQKTSSVSNYSASQSITIRRSSSNVFEGELKSEHCLSLMVCLPNDLTEPEQVLESYLNEFDKQGEWQEFHQHRHGKWEERVGHESCADRGIFGDQAGLIRQTLGLQVWISHVRLNEHPLDSHWSWQPSWGPRTTVAYLKLPSGQGICAKWHPGEMELHAFGAYEVSAESGHAAPISLPPKLSKEEKGRFRHAVKLLGLKPHLHWSQSGNELNALPQQMGKNVKDESEKKNKKRRSEPQLTMLMKTIAQYPDR